MDIKYSCKYCGRKDLFATEIVFRYGNRVRYCKDCRNKLQTKYRELRGRERERIKYIEYKYGVSEESYQEVYKFQEGKCAICNQIDSSGRTLCVDHNHKTEQVRGLICNNCNRVLGMIKDDKEILMKMYSYLLQYEETIKSE